MKPHTEVHISGFQPEDTQISSCTTVSHKVDSSSLFGPVGRTIGTSLNSYEKSRDESHLFVKQFMSDAWASDDDEELDNLEKVSVDVEQPKTNWNTNHALQNR